MSKTIVITGANSGIGLSTARALAGKGYNVVTICRKAIEGNRLIAELKQIDPRIKAENFVADLSDLNTVRNAAEAILKKYPLIDRLINNAGYYPSTIEYIGGIEKTLMASHLGHMLLTRLLLPALQRSEEARIINVSSALHMQGRVERFFVKPAKHNFGKAYGDAKLANVLFAIALSKQLPENITTYSLHPGVVNTNFSRDITGAFKFFITLFKPFFITPEQGAQTTLYLVDTDIKNIKSLSGKYFDKKKPARTSKEVTSENAQWLWEKSNEILEPYLK
jgi:retinol dehydrogenase-12